MRYCIVNTTDKFFLEFQKLQYRDIQIKFEIYNTEIPRQKRNLTLNVTFVAENETTPYYIYPTNILETLYGYGDRTFSYEISSYFAGPALQYRYKLLSSVNPSGFGSCFSDQPEACMPQQEITLILPNITESVHVDKIRHIDSEEEP